MYRVAGNLLRSPSIERVMRASLNVGSFFLALRFRREFDSKSVGIEKINRFHKAMICDADNVDTSVFKAPLRSSDCVDGIHTQRDMIDPGRRIR